MIDLKDEVSCQYFVKELARSYTIDFTQMDKVTVHLTKQSNLSKNETKELADELFLIQRNRSNGKEEGTCSREYSLCEPDQICVLRQIQEVERNNRMYRNAVAKDPTLRLGSITFICA